MINTSFKIQPGRRVAGGVVEIHEHDTDILWVTEGTATLIMGGTAVNAKPSGPGEIRAEKIEGGTTRKVTKGDLIVIPPNIPHWFSAVDGEKFLYFVVKVTK
jgi:quercetin dioxygenase-like cupin family protein